MQNQLQAGFLACVLPRGSFPSCTDSPVRDSGLNATRISDFPIGANAHSGATAADFNRVPISSIPKQNAPEPAIRKTTFSKNSRIDTQPPDKSQEKTTNILRCLFNELDKFGLPQLFLLKSCLMYDIMEHVRMPTEATLTYLLGVHRARYKATSVKGNSWHSQISK